MLIASGAAKEKFRKAIYAEAASGAKDDHDFTPPREYLGVYLDRRRESGFQLYNTLGIARGDKMAYAKQALENYNFFGAPHVAIIHTDEPLGIYGAVDCGAYVGNFMLAAQALGLGTIPQAALARHSGLIRRHFNLADDRKVVCGISFGFADNAAQGQQLPHLAGERGRYRDVRGQYTSRIAFVIPASTSFVPVTRSVDGGQARHDEGSASRPAVFVTSSDRFARAPPRRSGSSGSQLRRACRDPASARAQPAQSPPSTGSLQDAHDSVPRALSP